MLKRLFDVTAAALGLVIASPLLAAIAALIKLDSRGPVFYRGRRAGRNGHAFAIYKFRTMVADAERLGGSSTSEKDPRITRVGKFLRNYKLDELPQLINVFLGEMSIVGPRPEVQKYVDRYSPEERTILQVRPGITDWASIWNSDEGSVLAGADDPDKAYEELIRPTKLKLQLKYVRDRSLWVDLKIIAFTAGRLLRSDWLPTELRPFGRLAEPAVLKPTRDVSDSYTAARRKDAA